jgi:hypothetical protein
MRDSIALAESLQAAAPAATLLSREDSIAIAAAVTQRIAQRPASAPAERRDSLSLAAMADSIRREIQRAVLDSLTRGTRVPVMRPLDATVTASESNFDVTVQRMTATRGPVREMRRVVVAPPRPSRGRPELNAAARTIVDSLTASFSRVSWFSVVPRDSVEAVLQRSRTLDAVREALQADVIVSLSFLPEGPDSTTRIVQVRDLTVPDGRTATRVLPARVPNTNPLLGAESLPREVIRAVVDLERPERPPRPPGG